MKSDDQRIGLLVETLEVIFGLEEKTIDKVVRAITSSPDSIDVRNHRLRARIGPRAVQYLRNAIEIARHEGTEKHERGKTSDNAKHSDIAPTSRGRKRKKLKEAYNMAMTFSEFLLNEVSIDVDLDDAQGSTQELRRAQRLHKTSPERLNREQMIKAKQDHKDAQASGNEPDANIKSKIAKKKMEVGQLNRRLNSMSTVDRGET